MPYKTIPFIVEVLQNEENEIQHVIVRTPQASVVAITDHIVDIGSYMLDFLYPAKDA